MSCVHVSMGLENWNSLPSPTSTHTYFILFLRSFSSWLFPSKQLKKHTSFHLYRYDTDMIGNAGLVIQQPSILQSGTNEDMERTLLWGFKINLLTFSTPRPPHPHPTDDLDSAEFFLSSMHLTCERRADLSIQKTYNWSNNCKYSLGCSFKLSP